MNFKFDSGMAGVVIVTLALIGSIMAGFLLSGSTHTEESDDYNYITDVGGLYEYDPVTAYSNYNPNQNNYQYNANLSELGKYTKNINYTKSDTANMNPVLTEESSITTKTVTLTEDEMLSIGTYSCQNYNSLFYGGAYLYSANNERMHIRATEIDGYNEATVVLISISDLVSKLGYPNSITFTPKIVTQNVKLVWQVASQNFGYADCSVNYQPISIVTYEERKSTGNPISGDMTGVAYYRNSQDNFIGVSLEAANQSTVSISDSNSTTFSGTYPTLYAELRNISISGATITYELVTGETTNYYTKNTSDVYLCYWTGTTNLASSGGIDFTVSAYANTDYLDSNYGVSPNASTVYWSNDHVNGSVQWTFKKPTSSTAFGYTYTSEQGYTNDNGNIIDVGTLNSWTIQYDNAWYFTYTDTNGKEQTVNLGTWDGLQVKEWYTGQIQITMVYYFNNFNSYLTKSTNIYQMQNDTSHGIIRYKIESKVIDGETTYSNDTYSRNFGYTANSIINTTISVGSTNIEINGIKYTPTSSYLQSSALPIVYNNTPFYVEIRGYDTSNSTMTVKVYGETGTISATEIEIINDTLTITKSDGTTTNYTLAAKTLKIATMDYEYIVRSNSTSENKTAIVLANTSIISAFMNGDTLLQSSGNKDKLTGTALALDGTNSGTVNATGNSSAINGTNGYYVLFNRAFVTEDGWISSVILRNIFFPSSITLTNTDTNDIIRFAVTGTQVASGTVYGAMYDATFTIAAYYPDLETARLSFDSILYAGSSITVGDFTITTDQITMTGLLPDGTKIDLNKPIAFVWRFDGNLMLQYYQQGKSSQSEYIIGQNYDKVVNLNGQWVLDTDLYSLTLGTKDVYDWNFGTWGLDKDVFLIAIIGLSLLFTILSRVMGVELGKLDILIILGADAVIWMIL